MYIYKSLNQYMKNIYFFIFISFSFLNNIQFSFLSAKNEPNEGSTTYA